MPEPAHARQLTSTVYATPLMTPTTALGLSIRLSMFELRETGDWDIFLGPPERARAETGGADQWVLKRRECSGFARVNKELPHPWDTHYQFSIKTLLSNNSICAFVKCACPPIPLLKHIEMPADIVIASLPHTATQCNTL